MGTRINLLFGHGMRDWTDRHESIRILSSTLSATQKLAAYWTDGVLNDSPDNERWVAAPPFPPPETRNYHRYTGPGPLFIDVNPFAVRVRTGGRWRGFVSIQPLRSIHIQVFNSLFNAFGALAYRIFPDSDFLDDAFWEGGDFKTCTDVLNSRFGRPIPLQERVDPQMVAKVDARCPLVQYKYSLQ